MIYNLFSKETKELVDRAEVGSFNPIMLNKNHVNKDYKKAFPYCYDEELHFVYEGSLDKPHKVNDDFSIYFYNDRELFEMGERELKEGEKIEGDSVIYIPAPNSYSSWNGSEWAEDAARKEECLMQLKEAKKAEVTAHRDSIRDTGTIDYKGHAQRYRKQDISDISYYQRRLEKAQAKTGTVTTMNWYFFDESSMVVNAEDFDNILILTDVPLQSLYSNEQKLKNGIDNLETIEEVENYDINQNWE